MIVEEVKLLELGEHTQLWRECLEVVAREVKKLEMP